MADRLTTHKCVVCGKGIVASQLRFRSRKPHHRGCLPKKEPEDVEEAVPADKQPTNKPPQKPGPKSQTL